MFYYKISTERAALNTDLDHSFIHSRMFQNFRLIRPILSIFMLKECKILNIRGFINYWKISP